MDLSGVDIGAAYTAVGNVLGTPAVLLVFWVVSQLKELKTKVRLLEKEHSAVKETLGNIRSDVSYIRGVLEKKE